MPLEGEATGLLGEVAGLLGEGEATGLLGEATGLFGEVAGLLGGAVTATAGLTGDVLAAGLRVVTVLGLETVLIGGRGGVATTEGLDFGAKGVVGAAA
jgi:hypothetical protein